MPAHGTRRRRASMRAWTATASLFAVAGCLLWLPVVGTSLATSLARPPHTVLAAQRIGAHAGARSSAATRVHLPIRANLLGASWSGAGGSIQLRARGADGRWSDWIRLAAEPTEGPDAGSPEYHGARSSLPLPVWVGDATDVEVRGGGRDLQLVSINSTGTAHATDRVVTGLRQSAARVLGALGAEARAVPAKPGIITRAQWGADESIRRAPPSVASALKGAVVHHTVNANSYSRADAPALVRGIYTYHVKSNGWNDIGYNFLVDRFGRVYEGRYGGVEKAVIGAHTMGFNTGTAGMAYIGTHSSTAPSTAARRAMRNLVSWRLDKAHVRPTSNVTYTSAGNPSYPAGTHITRSAVGGHRNFYGTECPGGAAYRLLAGMRRSAWTRGGSKFASPAASVQTDASGIVTGASFTATGNRKLTYRLEIVRNSDGQVIRTLTQTATNASIDWAGGTSDGPVHGWDVDWRLTATDGTTAATPYRRQLVVAPAAPGLQVRAASPHFLSPNGDGIGDRVTARYSLRGAARVTVQIVDADDHSDVIRTLLNARLRSAGSRSVTWDGMLGNGTRAPVGSYAIRVFAADRLDARGDDDEAFVPFELDGTIALGRVSSAFNPARRSLQVVASSSAARTVTVAIHRGSKRVRLLYSGALNGRVRWTFDGRTGGGAMLGEGTYTVRLTSALATGTYRLTRTVRIDTTAPTGTATRRADGRLQLRLGERALVRGRVLRGGRWVVRGRWFGRGRHASGQFAGARRLRWSDVAGNARRVRVR